MAKMGRKGLYTAAEVARFCQVDLKTIHNWVERNKISHFRTPGRHLRFRKEDILTFLKQYGYPVPSELMDGRPKIAIVADDATAITDTLSGDFEAVTYHDPAEALIAIGNRPPDAVIIGAVRERPLTGDDVVRGLANADATKHVRTLVFGTTTSRPEDVVCATPDVHELLGRLRETLGLVASTPVSATA